MMGVESTQRRAVSVHCCPFQVHAQAPDGQTEENTFSRSVATGHFLVVTASFSTETSPGTAAAVAATVGLVCRVLCHPQGLCGPTGAGADQVDV